MKKNRRIGQLLPWAVLMAVYALMVLFFALYGSHNLNADDASEMVLAAQLNEEGVFLSENWLYSTELRVISPVPLYQLGLKLFDSWHAARTFAQALVMLGIAASALYMAYELGMKKRAPLLAAVFLLPFSFEYAYIMLLGCYYSVHLMLSLVMIGLTFRFGRLGLKKGKAALFLLAVMGLVCGVGGLRMLTMLVAPLAIAAVALALLAMRRYETFRASAHDPSVRMAGAVLLSTLLSGAGYIFNAKVLGSAYTYQMYGDMQMGRVNVGEFANQINGIIRTFGYRDNAALFSVKGMACWLALALTGMLFAALARLFMRRRELAPQQALLALTAGAAVALGMMLNVFLGQLLVRYFIVGTMLMVASLFVAMETEPCRNAVLRHLAVYALAGCFAFLSVCTFLYDFRQGEVNYEMTAKWLLDHGYTQGYASFWNANTITEASDGQIEMWVLADNKSVNTHGDWADMQLQRTLQHRRHLEEAPEGKVFLLADELEYEYGSPLLDEAHYVGMVAWSYYVYEYDNADEMRALLGS